MKIVLLANSQDIHTVRWVKALRHRGHTVYLASLHSGGRGDIDYFQLSIKHPLGYLLNFFQLYSLINKLRPDILHAHYASGYGTLGRLINFTPLIISVWGSDIYSVPERSPLHKLMVTGNLKAADHICSTSYAMAEEVERLRSNTTPLSITPFGVNTDEFCPKRGSSTDEGITIATAKRLEHKYGIDILIRAFAQLKLLLASDSPAVASGMRLLIYGDGEQESELRELARKLSVGRQVFFKGRVPHDQMPDRLSEIDIFVALSRRESFGVAVLEASACEVPVVVSRVGGLPEVVQDGVTGRLVEKENPVAAAHALYELVQDSALRDRMGRAGRAMVQKKYEWDACVSKMERVYEQVLSQS